MEKYFDEEFELNKTKEDKEDILQNVSISVAHADSGSAIDKIDIACGYPVVNRKEIAESRKNPYSPSLTSLILDSDKDSPITTVEYMFAKLCLDNRYKINRENLLYIIYKLDEILRDIFYLNPKATPTINLHNTDGNVIFSKKYWYLTCGAIAYPDENNKVFDKTIEYLLEGNHGYTHMFTIECAHAVRSEGKYIKYVKIDTLLRKVKID